MKKYAVIVYYTSEPESEVYIFDNYEKACEYLREMWKHCLDFATEDDDFNKEDSFCDECFAQIKWGNEDGLIRIWEVIPVSNPIRF